VIKKDAFEMLTVAGKGGGLKKRGLEASKAKRCRDKTKGIWGGEGFGRGRRNVKECF